MNDIDKIIKKILMDDTFQPLREKYIVDLKSKTSSTANFEIFTSNFKPNKHYFMKAELLHVAENINDEASEILDYKILKINQRIRLNSDLNISSNTMMGYVSNAYSIKLLAMNDTYQRIIYYLLYIYEPVENLYNLIAEKKLSYSTEELINNLLNICETIKDCHHVNICHNDITLENIFLSQTGEYKLGKIDMKNFVNFSSNANPTASTELSIKNDLIMLGRVMEDLVSRTSRKNAAQHKRLQKIASKACRISGGYKDIDEIINELQKVLTHKGSKLMPILATVGVLAVVGILVAGFLSTSDKRMLGDVNGDGVIDNSDVSELQDIYSDLAVSTEGLDPELKAVCDINSDGYIDMIDVSYLLDYISYQDKNDSRMDVKEFVEFRMNE